MNISITWSRVLAFIAAIIFILATFHVSLGGLEMVPLGLFFVAAALVLP